MCRFILSAAVLSALLGSISYCDAASAGSLTFGNNKANALFGISNAQNNAWTIANSVRGGSTGECAGRYGILLASQT